jgi:hypothetical protein
MTGLVPAIHDFFPQSKDVDARHRAGHDGDNRRSCTIQEDCAFTLSHQGQTPDITW